MEEIIFDITHEYNTLESGIVVPVSLIFGAESVDLRLKLIQVRNFVFFKGNKASGWV